MADESLQRVLARLEKLHAIGIALSSETDTDRLLETILLGAKDLTNADAGTLYRLGEDDRLHFATVRNDSLSIALGGTTGSPVTFEPLRLYTEAGEPNHNNVAACAALQGKTFNIPDAYAAGDFDFSGTRRVDQRTGYVSRSFLTVPLKNHEGDVVGVLQLINAKDPATGQVVAFTEADQRLAESLASQAATALTKKALIDSQKELFESFIQLVARAIDEKNPHTSAHCERVPELTLMIAEAVDRAGWGPFKDLRFSPDEMYEIKIASWMHDCGKVTTPEHVINKATKLETIVDRIHWVDTRFEVIKRDLRIQILEQALARAGATVPADLDEACQERLAELDADRAFLRKSNVGGEFMSDEDVQRVARIGTGYHWQNPAGERAPLLSDEEIYNLQIRRGTITAEERQIMNNHMDVTIAMLEALPYPKHLRRVPEIAGGHHERMDGRGFPKGLTREQMSVPARIMGIADIFEALTASERPYKKPMPVSQALTILGRMKLDRHIDPDLFDIFVRERVWQRYAQRHLKPEQLDEVRLDQIPGYEPLPEELAAARQQAG